MTASVTLIDDVSDLNLVANGYVGPARTLSATQFPSNIDYFSFDFNKVYNDTYKLSPPDLSITGYMLIKISSNNTVLYQVDIINGILKNGEVELNRQLTYFKINNINSDQLTIEWNPHIPTASTYFSEYVKAYFYKLDPYIQLITSNNTKYSSIYLKITKMFVDETYLIVLGDSRYFEFNSYNINSIDSIKLFDESSNEFSLDVENIETNKYRATLRTNGKNIESKSYQIKFECKNLKDETVTIKHNTTEPYIKINVIIPYVFTYDSTISITNTINDLTVKIDLDHFIENSSVNETWTFWSTHNWTDFHIKFKYDGNVVLTTQFTNPPQKNFEISMLLTQLKSDVLFAFEIIWKKNPKYDPNGTIVYTSSNFTLVNQNITYNSFEVSPKSNTDNLLFKTVDQYIYMYKTTPEIFKNEAIISDSIVNYSVHYLKSSAEYNSINDIDKAQLRLKLTKIDTTDTIDFDTLETFIFTKVDFSAFHTPTITPISNIHYFKEKTFEFNVSDNKYSFTFDSITYDIIFKSGTYTINSFDKNNIIKITDLITEKYNVEIDILPYSFTHGENTLKFFMHNTLEGVESIHLPSSIVSKTITSKPIDIVLNVESDALVSCKVQ